MTRKVSYNTNYPVDLIHLAWENEERGGDSEHGAHLVDSARLSHQMTVIGGFGDSGNLIINELQG